ncbi:Ribonuclease H [Abeliophyllum distichum]|uniref:Ribonuclease H n=1 Tax=Abeliophyllum distichum TaxID=126358 RepID=A0ABD1QV85_9LAMI
MDTRLENERLKLECDLDEDDENLSFSKQLKARELSVEFKMPSMEKYKGIDDPTNHINVYKTRLQGYISVVKCRNFHTTLVFDVKRWYNKLKLGSIKSWLQLKQEFINAFIGNRKMIADIA